MPLVSASSTSLSTWVTAARQRGAVTQPVRRPSVAVRAGFMPWVPFWLSLGIGGWFLLPQEPGTRFYSTLFLAGCLCLAGQFLIAKAAEAGRCDWNQADRWRIAGFALFLAIIGAGLAGARAHMVAAPVLEFRYYGPVEGRVVAIDRSSRDRMRLLLDQVHLRDVAPARTPKRLRISLMDDASLPVPGQHVMLTAHLGPPNGPSEPGAFDFRRVAWFDGLGAVGYSRTPVMTVAPPDPGGALALHRARMSMSAAMIEQIGGQAGAVSSALMTGDRSGILETTNDIMRASNLYHIISISGLHMSMLAGFVYAWLRVLGAVLQSVTGFRAIPLHKLAAGGALAASALYLWLSGGGVATERSFIMVAVMLFAIIVDRRAVSLRTIALAAIIVLVLSPEALTEASFQMSFAATSALILMQEPWSRLSPHLPWWSRHIIMLILTSAVASMATSPIAAIHFGRMTQYGVLANLLVVPVVGAVVMPGGVIAALLAPLGLAQPALWFMGMGTKWMLFIAEWIAGLGGSVMYVASAPRIVLPLLGTGAMLMLLAPMPPANGKTTLTRLRRRSGVVLLILAGLIWAQAKRPDILVSAEGDAVGIMTPAGRVPSKPKGGSFSIQNWLEADGDAADQATAAARPLWSGAPSNRWADLGPGRGHLQVRHVTGKSAEGSLQKYCRDGVLLIINKKAEPSMKTGKCQILDLGFLRRHGAVAVTIGSDGFAFNPSGEQSSGRIWQ